MNGPPLPDPFYVKIIEGLASLEAKLVSLEAEIARLVQVGQHETLKREVSIQRWILGGFFLGLLTLAGWILGLKGA